MNRIQNAYLGMPLLVAGLLAAVESSAAAAGATPRATAQVHMKNAEGFLTIDALTGQVLGDPAERPEWAVERGLVIAQLAERHQFYAKRLGDQYAQEHKAPELFAFEDLCWLAVEPESGGEVQLDASDEHRMDVMAAVLKIDRETGDIEGALAEVEVAQDDTRTTAEMDSLTESQQQEFAKAAEA